MDKALFFEQTFDRSGRIPEGPNVYRPAVLFDTPRSSGAKCSLAPSVGNGNIALRWSAILLTLGLVYKHSAPPEQVYTLVVAKSRAVIFAFCLLFLLSGCGPPRNDQPTPGAAKQLLKLRGYEFDEESFLRAAAASDLIAVNTFFAAGINPNAKDESSGATALIAAASRGDMPIVQALLKRNAHVNERDNAQFTALLRALQNKHDAVAEILLTRPDTDVNAQGSNRMTALLHYVIRNQANTVQNLLDRGANANLRDDEGDTALHVASQRGNVNIVQMLLAKGADPNAMNKLGGTPLMWAGVYGHEDVARALLGKGADPKLKDVDGMTAAAWAAKNQRDEMAQLLLDAEKR
jgi:ankyrin repeat protein